MRRKLWSTYFSYRLWYHKHNSYFKMILLFVFVYLFILWFNLEPDYLCIVLNSHKNNISHGLLYVLLNHLFVCDKIWENACIYTINSQSLSLSLFADAVPWHPWTPIPIWRSNHLFMFNRSNPCIPIFTFLCFCDSSLQHYMTFLV